VEITKLTGGITELITVWTMTYWQRVYQNVRSI